MKSGTATSTRADTSVFPCRAMIIFMTRCGTSQRNALRANLVNLAEHWPWSSLAWATRPKPGFSVLADWPVPRPADWLEIVNRPQSQAELEALRKCANRGSRSETQVLAAATARFLAIEFTLRTRGRPKQRL